MHIKKVQEGLFTKTPCHNCHKEKATHRITGVVGTDMHCRGYCISCAKKLYDKQLKHEKKWANSESENTAYMLSRI